MDLIKKEVEVTKEANEIFELLGTLVTEVKAVIAKGEDAEMQKTDWAAIALKILPALGTAIEGIDKLGEEIKSEHFYDTAALGLANVVKAILDK